MNIKKNGSAIYLGVLFVIFISGSIVLAQETLKGKTFCDPGIQQTMSADWLSKPITYHESAGKVDLSIDLNQQLYPHLLPFVTEFEKENNIKIHITEGTCGKSSGKLGRKEVDIGGFCCPPGEIDRLPGLKFHTLGITPLAILVHPDNPLDNISLETARKIFQGDISSWKEINGSDTSIQPISSLHCKKRPGHWQLLLANEDLFTPNLMEIGDMTDQISLISSTPNAIGYESLNVAERFKDRGIVKGLSLNGHNPRNLNPLLKGEYPIYRVFNLTTWEGAHLKKDLAQNLVKFLQSKIPLIQEKASIIPHLKLKETGWQFKQDELIGEPL